MTEQLHTTLRDSAAVRWTALVLLALTMFFAYMFIDVLAPLSTAPGCADGTAQEVGE